MKKIQMSVVVFGGLLVGVGCAPTQLGKNTGTSYYTMMESQILHPEAGQTQDPVEGLDGKAAMNSIDHYRKTFEKPDADLGTSMTSSGIQTK